MASSDASSARRVVTGLNRDGRSIIVSDDPTPTWVRRPTGAVVSDIWRLDCLPARIDADSTLTDQVVLAPPPHGVCIRVTTFPPDSAITPEAAAAYAAAMEEIYGAQQDSGPDDKAIPGMHRTDTIDVATVIDGEVYLIMEDGETLLRAGDSVVQRGTRHAWSNRSDRPATLATTMMPALRD